MLRSWVLILVAFCVLVNCRIRPRRQTYIYDDSLRAYAQPHAGTKIQQGVVGRYAPQDWPSWYSRMMMKWDSNTILAPYENTDRNYANWKNEFISRSRFIGSSNNN